MTYYGKGGFAAAGLVVSMLIGCAAQAQDFTLKTSGRVMIDYAAVNANSGAKWDATELRRARLGVSGQYGSNVKYKVEFNTNSSEDINVEDAWVQFKPGAGKWKIKAGQFKTPNSLDEQTSSRFISTHERASFTDAFGFDRRVGVAASTGGDNYSFTAGIFTTNLTNIDDEEGMAIAARATYTPINTKETVVHLGASVRYRDQKNDGNIRYRQRPVSHIPGRIISTGSFADKDTFYGVEAAAIMGKFWAAGEYGQTNANNASGGTDGDFSGFYAEAGAFFGGRKTYKGHKFNRPKIDNPVTNGGYGALSLVARYDALDLEGNAVNGGKLDSVVIGADWWPTKNTRLGVNYFNSDADLGTSTSGLDSDFASLVTNPAITKESVDGFIARLQFDF
ncbi:MAG: OprO/OprP family phosphate-selective porin [Maricaulaceae bacterium]